ncbi:MAG: hypothetical protein KDK39_19360, partial [Leptospiraceae bacterium]|nr:hypothetical protein [Leptospiraceae bacterium]
MDNKQQKPTINVALICALFVGLLTNHCQPGLPSSFGAEQFLALLGGSQTRENLVQVITGSTVTSEAGATSSLQVNLRRRPTQAVQLQVTSSDTSEGLVDVSVLTFTPENWSAQQLVTISGQDDTIADGD